MLAKIIIFLLKLQINHLLSKQKDDTLAFLNGTLLFIVGLLLILCPLFIFYHHAQDTISTLETINYDDAKGTVTNITIIDTGKTKELKDRTCQHIKTSKEYKSKTTYMYQDNGVYKEKIFESKLTSDEEVRQFKNKYPIGAKLELKINPHDRSNVIIKPYYFITFFCFIVITCFFYPIPIFIGVNILQYLILGNNITQRFNSLKLKAITFNDITNQDSTINAQVKWHSVAKFKPSYFCYKILRNHSVITLKPVLPLFSYIGAFVSLIIGLFFTLFIDFKQGIIPLVLIIFILIIIYFYIPRTKNIKFDKLSGYYYQTNDDVKNNDFLDIDTDNKFPISNIKATQILGDLGNRNGFLWELNLILKDNRRINIYKKNSFTQILRLADEIADFLNIKVFIDPVINKDTLDRYI